MSTPYTSKFSDFIRMATVEEKRKVYVEVMRKVALQIQKTFQVPAHKTGKPDCDCVGVVHTCNKIC